MIALGDALARFGGILIRPNATLSSLRADEGRFDGWVLALLFVLGSQIERLTGAAARFEVFGSVLLLVNALALALLTPVLVGFMVEGVVGATRSRYRHLPLVALVLVATLGNLLRQQGVALPGPRYLPEMIGAIWALGLALWIRKRMPASEQASPGGRNHRIQQVIGALVIALTVLAGARDLTIGLRNWDSAGPVGPSDPIPEFTARVSDGTVLTPAALDGQVSLLTFWATWCHACGLEMPILSAIEQRYAGTDLHIYGVNRDSGETAQRQSMVENYLRDHQIGFAQIYDDGQLARAFEVEGIPHMVLVDRHGQIRHVHMGRVSERTLSKEIDALLAE
ncbi:MAG TPA: TlpA disulfide reductase family protein [Enhygromyxa sp.]|nr:TlpA disulfide reductase family protein [Enhygromyxa sp.]